MNNGKRYTYLYAAVFAVFMFFLFFSLGLHYLGASDFSYVLRWWMTLLLLGLAFQPLTIVIFKNLRDGGWLFSKTLGIALGGWLMWFLGSCRILKFTRFNCALVVVVVFAVNILVYYLMEMRKTRNGALRRFYTDERICAIIGVESIFFCVFPTICFRYYMMISALI